MKKSTWSPASSSFPLGSTSAAAAVLCSNGMGGYSLRDSHRAACRYAMLCVSLALKVTAPLPLLVVSAAEPPAAAPPLLFLAATTRDSSPRSFCSTRGFADTR